MTWWHLLLGIVVAFCFYWGWRLSHRRPWDGKLGTWKLDPLIAKGRRRFNYWPIPTHPKPGWLHPQLQVRQNRSYCLRCGKWPYTGPELMYSKTVGFTFLCSLCCLKQHTSKAELLRYAHMVIDLKIVQNFDPHITHPDDAAPITEFTAMWPGIQNSVDRLEAIRG